MMDTVLDISDPPKYYPTPRSGAPTNHQIINLDDYSETGWGHETEEVMLVNKLFEGVRFYKTGRVVDAMGARYMVYESVLSSSLMGGKQLLRITVPESSAVQDSGTLQELGWKSLSSLIGNPYLKLREVMWKPPSGVSSILTRMPFTAIQRDDNYTTYLSPGGMELKIKLDTRVKGVHQYPNTVTLLFAIEKFKTTLVR